MPFATYTGPISSVTVLGQTMIIINDAQITFELMRDRSAIHSSRPSQIFSGEMYARSQPPSSSPERDHMKMLTKHPASDGKMQLH